MAYTDAFSEYAPFGDLYELTIQEAAEKLHDGLWDHEQASVEEIKDALIDAIIRGELEPVRGSLRSIGKYCNNPPILDAFVVAGWAERNGLELESNGSWNDYILGEAELAEALEERKQALLALRQSGKEREEFDAVSREPERMRDQYISLLVQNERLKADLAAMGEGSHPPQKTNPKSLDSLLKMVIAMAIEGYGFNPDDKKSQIPGAIATAVEKLGLSIDPDTTRRWLRQGAELLPPKAKKT